MKSRGASLAMKTRVFGPLGMTSAVFEIIKAGVDADKGAGHLTSAMWHHAWTGLLVIDLDQPMRRTSGITVRQGPAA